jgi:hypothetical protein
MTLGGAEPGRPTLSFDEWKLQLRKDSERESKLVAFNALSDYVLKLLWKSGVAPSCSAIIESTPQTTKPS